MRYIGKQSGTRPRGATFVRVVAADTYDDAASVDLVAVERAVNEDAPEGLTMAEKARAAVILFERKGMTPNSIAVHLHTRSDSVWGWLGMTRPPRQYKRTGSHRLPVTETAAAGGGAR